jgi:hypothetical protein
VVALLGANEGLARVAGNDPTGTCLARRRFVADGDSAAVVPTRDIRLREQCSSALISCVMQIGSIW